MNGYAGAMPTGTSAGQPQVLTYLRVLRRRKWTILLVALLATAGALGFAESETPVYQSSAQILLEASPAAQVIGGSAGAAAPNPQDQIAVLEGPGVAALVDKALGSAPTISASTLSGTDLIQITASSTSAPEAARVANAYADAYISYQRTQTVNGLVGAERILQGRIAALQTELNALEAQSARSSAAQQSALQPQITALSQQLALLTSELDSLQSSVALGFGGAEVVKPAAAPGSPASPRKLRLGLLGLGGGLVVGIALAFVRESLDDTIVAREDIERVLPELPVLAEIPHVAARRGDSPPLVSVSRPHSEAAEAYRTLRTSVQFLALDRSLHRLQVTSPRTTEGKTTTLANLAVTLASAGQRVVVVDCDFRRPRLHDLFGLGNEVGFASVLLGQSSLPAALRDVPGHHGLRLLASGARPPNPSELLASGRVAQVLESLGEDADLVLVDSPPVLPVTDAVALAPRMDATLVVVASGRTSGKDITRAMETLAQVDAQVVGAVLNDLQAADRYGYRYGYRYQPYTAREQREARRRVGGGTSSS